MAKTDDFGGLPSEDVTAILATFDPTGAQTITDAERIAVLAALAAEEHAATRSTNYDTIAVVMKAIEIRKTHALITKGGHPAGTIGDLVDLLGGLRLLWK